MGALTWKDRKGKVILIICAGQSVMPMNSIPLFFSSFTPQDQAS